MLSFPWELENHTKFFSQQRLASGGMGIRGLGRAGQVETLLAHLMGGIAWFSQWVYEL